MSKAVPSRSGFTLVEVMVATALGAVILAAVMSSYLFVGRNLARVSSYQALEAQSRIALAYLSRDLRHAQAVKSGTTPTASAVTLVLPSGEVAYTYDHATRSLRRTATFGVSPEITLLHNDTCECTAFTFRYFTATDGVPTDQSSPATFVPFSIKQVQVAFAVESPATWSAATRTRYEVVSSRHFLRNREAPDGT